jgi:hypothetical protein
LVETMGEMVEMLDNSNLLSTDGSVDLTGASIPFTNR